MLQRTFCKFCEGPLYTLLSERRAAPIVLKKGRVSSPDRKRGGSPLDALDPDRAQAAIGTSAVKLGLGSGEWGHVERTQKRKMKTRFASTPELGRLLYRQTADISTDGY